MTDTELTGTSTPALELSTYSCPSCGVAATTQALANAQYRCSGCGLEVAHVETTALGLPRRVIQWLRQPGDVILDRYRVVRVLGKGGFAATYLVEDLRVNGKKRALKEIPEALYNVTETELLSRLNHPSIPDITDQDWRDGMVYLVLELGGGRTLEAERKLAGGKVPLDRALSWLQQLGIVLAYLHSQTPPIIHRDLKPENVLLDELGRIMLIDFGIAKQAADDSQTRTLARAATHGYSPPEQAMGTGTGPCSDVYALAATFYALITGVVPPPAHQRVAGVELTDATTLVPELPASMAAALTQAMSLNINRRPPSIGAFLQAMGLMGTSADAAASTAPTVPIAAPGSPHDRNATSVRVRSDRLGVSPGAAPPRRSRPGLWGAIGVATIAATGAGLWLLQNEGGQPAETATPAPPVATLEATTGPGPLQPATAPAVTAGPAEPSPAAGPDVTTAPDEPPPRARAPEAMAGPAPATVEPTLPPTPALVSPETAAAPPLIPPPEPQPWRPEPITPEPGSTSSAAPPIAIGTAASPAAALAPPAQPPSIEAARGTAPASPPVDQPKRVVSVPAEPGKPVAPAPTPRPKPKPQKAPPAADGGGGWSGVYIGGSRSE